MRTRTNKKTTDLRERLCDGADMLIDFATLGEYGYEPVERQCLSVERSGTRRQGCVQPCSPARLHVVAGTGEATTALQRRAERLARFAA